MSGYSIGWGQPPMNCEVCGGRVPNEECHRHDQPIAGTQILRDKHAFIRVLRFVQRSHSYGR